MLLQSHLFRLLHRCLSSLRRPREESCPAGGHSPDRHEAELSPPKKVSTALSSSAPLSPATASTSVPPLPPLEGRLRSLRSEILEVSLVSLELLSLL